MFDIPDVKRRTAPRRWARVRCEAVVADGFSAVGGTLLDLSETGLLLESEIPLARGEELYLSFQAPRTTQWVSIVARVKRTLKPLDRRGCLAGLEIEDMDAVERSILMASIERLPPRPRARKVPRDYAAWVAEVSGLTDRPSMH